MHPDSLHGQAQSGANTRVNTAPVRRAQDEQSVAPRRPSAPNEGAGRGFENSRPAYRRGTLPRASSDAGLRRTPENARPETDAGSAPIPRLLRLHEAATYLSVSYWSVRDLVARGDIPAVRLPSPGARDGRALRRVLLDRRDLDRLIERHKECSA